MNTYNVNKYKLEIYSQQRTRNRVAIPFNSETEKTQEDKFLEPQYNLQRDPNWSY